MKHAWLWTLIAVLATAAVTRQQAFQAPMCIAALVTVIAIQDYVRDRVHTQITIAAGRPLLQE